MSRQGRRQASNEIHRTLFHNQDEEALSVARIFQSGEHVDKKEFADLFCDKTLVCSAAQNRGRGLSTRDQHPSCWVTLPRDQVRGKKAHFRCFRLRSNLPTQLEHSTDRYYKKLNYYHGNIRPREDIRLALVCDNSENEDGLSTARVQEMDGLEWIECFPGFVIRASAEVPFDKLPDDRNMRFALHALDIAARHESTADGALELLSLHSEIVVLPPNALFQLSSKKKVLLNRAFHVLMMHSEFSDVLFDVERAQEALSDENEPDSDEVKINTSPELLKQDHVFIIPDDIASKILPDPLKSCWYALRGTCNPDRCALRHMPNAHNVTPSVFLCKFYRSNSIRPGQATACAKPFCNQMHAKIVQIGEHLALVNEDQSVHMNEECPACLGPILELEVTSDGFLEMKRFKIPSITWDCSHTWHNAHASACGERQKPKELNAATMCCGFHRVIEQGVSRLFPFNNAPFRRAYLQHELLRKKTKWGSELCPYHNQNSRCWLHEKHAQDVTYPDCPFTHPPIDPNLDNVPLVPYRVSLYDPQKSIAPRVHMNQGALVE